MILCLAIGVTIFGSSAFAENLLGDQRAQYYTLMLGSPLPNDATIVTNAAHGDCVVEPSFTAITYVRPNSSYKGVDSCTVGYSVGTAFLVYFGVLVVTKFSI
ncbi:MAG: hypothetical protein V4596_09995 [Bdellovibrionota bacterium]